MQEETKAPTYGYPEVDDFSFRQLISQRMKDVNYILSHKKGLIICALAGILLGVAFAWWKPVTYSARLTFVVEDTKSSGGGLISALAGQFDFDLGGMGASSGILSGDNVQELLKSRKMVKETFLTPVEPGSSKSLADLYAESYKLKEKWKKHSKDGQISFPLPSDNYTRLQDSLLQVMIKKFSENELAVAKTDKKLSFFELNITTRNEQFSKLFTERIIQKATDFYIDTKTSRMRINIDRLQHRADSISRVLNRKTYSASSANQNLIDLNPAYETAKVAVEVGERDKMVLATIYSEVIKNLEVSRTMLMQETPTFQIVDDPELPLKKNKVDYLVSILLGAIIAVILYSLILLMLREKPLKRESL
ncbi:MAG TPA: hypothetical protein VLZ28_04630 [Daejeonella sp.]|nr:hypothetical protein [Daejeonella sp.]